MKWLSMVGHNLWGTCLLRPAWLELSLDQMNTKVPLDLTFIDFTQVDKRLSPNGVNEGPMHSKPPVFPMPDVSHIDS